MVGWTRPLSAEERAFVPAPYAALPTLGRLTGRGNTANVETVLAARPDVILDCWSPARRVGAGRYEGRSRERGTQSDPQDETAGAEAGMGRCSTARVGTSRKRSGSSIVAIASTMRL
jgi:ABC-type Fe3+-hydroxamate transport system substrate-binding protein